MTNATAKLYRVGVIERAIAYYNVEAEDARAAAENWQDGELFDRDDEALGSEGPCNVRERQPDGTWRNVPRQEWDDQAPAVSDSAAAQTGHTPGRWKPSDDGLGVWSGNEPLGRNKIIANCDAVARSREENQANCRRILDAVNACDGISTGALEAGVIHDMREALLRAFDRGYFDVHPDDSEIEQDDKLSARAVITRVQAEQFQGNGGANPVRFDIMPRSPDCADRLHVLVDNKFDVAIVRTDEGLVVDVYPKDGAETVASTYAYESEIDPDADRSVQE